MVAGCSSLAPKKPVERPKLYDKLEAKTGVPAFMSRSIWEKVDVGNTDPFQVSGYGLVVNLDNTGDSTAPTAVKEYIIKLMLKHGYGSKLNPGWENQPPERVLRDKRVAIVQVVGMLPPGVRKGETFDVVVQALPRNQTSSLAGGELYLTDLKINGADPHDPFNKINDYAQAKGFIFVNPAYALNKSTTAPTAVRASLRNGIVMDGCVAKYDRPIFLRLRSPETRMARNIEQRIIERFQDTTVAQAEDEGIVQIFVPRAYHGDWQHFARLVTHLYLESSPEFLTGKARILVAELQKPGAKLEDISYCFEGIGPMALPFLSPLLTDRRPDVAFAVARAAAFIGDPTGAANAALLAMARDSNHPFQLNAVEALGGLKASSAVNEMMHELLDSGKTLVRIEAYKVLARNGDPSIHTQVVTLPRQKFALDIVPSHGSSIIYASRTGMPRIALIGPMPTVGTPVMFRAMEDRFTINSQDVGNAIMIFYRSPAMTDSNGVVRDFRMSDPVKMLSQPELWAVVERLGGLANEGERPFNFTYSEVIAILQGLHKNRNLVAMDRGQEAPVAFVLQDPPAMQNVIYSAPSIDTGRPQGEDHEKITRNRDAAADAALVGRKLK
jgi:flagellar basal body P-ring protein FlgI